LQEGIEGLEVECRLVGYCLLDGFTALVRSYVERGDMEGLKALTQLLDRVAREEAGVEWHCLNRRHAWWHS